jgi:hypothetical protein|tara:strand:- start:236 stop:676 length:441 start_codon:yes stop_codon:yes gene_type:complete
MIYDFEISKNDLLERFANREVTEMIVLNGYNVAEGGDERISPGDEVDSDGHCVDIGTADELISDCPEVRLLIKPDLDIKTVLTLLSKITFLTKETAERLDCSLSPKCYSKETEDAKEMRIAKILFRNDLSSKEMKWYLSKQINASK